MQMFNAEHLQEKWAPLLDYDGADKITDSHRRMVTAVLLENQKVPCRGAVIPFQPQPTLLTLQAHLVDSVRSNPVVQLQVSTLF